MRDFVIVVTPPSSGLEYCRLLCCLQACPRSQQFDHAQFHHHFFQLHQNTSFIHPTDTHEASTHAHNQLVSVRSLWRVLGGRQGAGEATPLRLALNLTDTPRSQGHQQQAIVVTRPYLPVNQLAQCTRAQCALMHLVDIARIFPRRAITSLRLWRRTLAAHTTNNISSINTACTAPCHQTSIRIMVSCILLNIKVSHKNTSITAPY
jgi:hypothetical protein